MIRETYATMGGLKIRIADLTEEELKIYSVHREAFMAGVAWDQMPHYYGEAVGPLVRLGPLYKLCQDLNLKAGIRDGKVAPFFKIKETTKVRKRIAKHYPHVATLEAGTYFIRFLSIFIAV